MLESPLQLVKIPLMPARLARVARSRGLRLRDLDDGYLVHCIMKELWTDAAPSPFVLRENSNVVDVWGYTAATAAALTDQAKSFGDPVVLDAIDFGLGLSGRPMPVLDRGQRAWFRTRVCPVKRLSKAIHGHRAGAEVDAFLASVFHARREAVSREAVYCEWFSDRVSNADAVGATLTRVRVNGMSRTRLVRRTQAAERTASFLERPDVQLEGEFVVRDGAAFLRFLSHGVGRHRAFGFGAVMLVPPGSSRG